MSESENDSKNEGFSLVKEAAEREPGRRRDRSTPRSPLTHAESSAERKGLEQRYIRLPVTGQEIKCYATKLNPDDCFASPLNKRGQKWLTLDNPAFKKLYDSIRLEHQREPVLARPVKKDGRTQYEIIYGTRRRAVAALLHKELSEEGGFPLKAFVHSDISDVDARRLAISENDDREGISLWEEAMYLKDAMAEGGSYFEKSQAYIADRENCSQSRISKLIALSQLPEQWVGLLASPDLVDVTNGKRLAKTLTSYEQDSAQHFDTLSKEPPFTSMAELVEALLRAIKATKDSKAKPKTVSKKRPLSVSTETGKSVKISAHRTKDGVYNAVLDGFTDADIEKLAAFIRSLKS